ITFITLEGHGRQDAPGRIDISRTVGWFTVLYPVALELPESGDMGDQLKGIKESLRKIPDKGRGYGILKYMPESGNRGALISSPVPQVCFNYLGSLDGAAGNNIFTVEQETVLHTVAPGFRRDHLLDLEGMTLGGKLRLTLTYNRKAHKKETAETLLSWYRDELREIVAHCKGKETQERTPGDLTYSGLSLRELEEVYRMCDLERGNLKDIYPLSPMQEGMLFHTLYESGSTAYFEQLSFALEGVLDTEIFEDSWNELVKRHDIMRTSFAHRIAERPLQVVALERKIEFGFEDISTEDEYRRREHIEEFRQKDRERGFALSRDMLMRVKVFKLSENVFEVIWSHPHILMDGWCYGVIFKELFAFYEALRNAERPELEPVTPYRDYIAWLEEMDRGKSVNYWANYLSGYERAATIPTDMGETNGKRHVLKIENFTIGEDMTSKLRDIAIENQATVNSVIQGIWGVVLSGYNGSDDVVFGAAVSGRPAELPGIESMIGLFLNTVPVRIKTGAAQSFGDLIRHIQKDSISGEAHHYCSIADIQSQSVLKQDLLDHVIVFENYPLEQELSVSGGGDGTALTISSIEIFEHTSYALSIEVTPGKRMSFMVRYNGAAYSAGRIAEVKDRILTLIGAVAEQPEIPVTDLKGLLTSGAEKGEQMDFIHSILEIDEDF
ncbi:MAG: condensation domain-containing protein, partial [Dissulfurispiraceae bacterium]